MNTVIQKNPKAGFTLIEILLSMLVLGFVLIAVAGIFMLYQKGSAQTTEFAEAQQNARVAIDYITEDLRQAGSQTDYFRGQRPIVHAGPYQVAINADIDNGRTIDGQGPLTAISRAASPNSVPQTGTPIYIPPADYQSTAETIVFTIDSNSDGTVSTADRGDDPEENGRNTNLFVLKKVVYGYNGSGSNDVRESNLAVIRGPNFAPTWTVPQPLFQYFYDHDENPGTPDILWGDANGNDVLDTAEIGGLSPMPNNLLSTIRKIKITAIAESNRYDKRYETNGGYLDVTMSSEVYVRNATRTSAMIYGRVFHDMDSDGVIDTGETGIPGVQLRLAGQSRSVVTDNFGLFYFPLPAGDYTVQEVDPPGYTSTTSNIVSVTVVAGQTQVVNFGDLSSSDIGVIQGTVYEDLDQNGVKGVDEHGLPGVVISLDTGAQTITNDTGYYSFVAEQGNYTVIETDPAGYSSTTPNSRAANIVAMGDTVTVNFGDYAGPVSGTLEGYVFYDTNEDGIRDLGEEGIPNATLIVSNGDSTMTNARGYYRFNLEPAMYKITEIDPPGYTSTTVNTYTNIVITADTTVVRDFGDILESRQDFVEIHISNTDRVLSVTTANLKEDDMYDTDIVLGTALGVGIGNMLVFHNKWLNSTTPITELFDSDPTYRRDAGYNINTMSRYDLSGDGVPDVLSGLDYSTGYNIQIWFTRSEGLLSMIPDAAYASQGLTEVMDCKLADLDRDGNVDLIVGLKSPLGNLGAFETLRGIGGATFTHWQIISTAGSDTEVDLGAIWAVEAADIDGDGDQDIVVGSHTGAYAGYVDIYENVGYATGDLVWHSRYRSFGGVNDLRTVDMMEDDGGDPDIIAAVSSGANIGVVVLWLNNGTGTFGVPDTTGFAFGPNDMPRWPDDGVNAYGEALSMAIVSVNNDVFPDVAYGTRSSEFYTGDIYILPAYGTLPSSGIKINSTESGEIITMDVADFNKDNRPDIVVGTRSSATQGKLVAYFGREL